MKSLPSAVTAVITLRCVNARKASVHFIAHKYEKNQRAGDKSATCKGGFTRSAGDESATCEGGFSRSADGK
jgi:hypothetical protein